MFDSKRLIACCRFKFYVDQRLALPALVAWWNVVLVPCQARLGKKRIFRSAAAVAARKQPSQQTPAVAPTGSTVQPRAASSGDVITIDSDEDDASADDEDDDDEEEEEPAAVSSAPIAVGRLATPPVPRGSLSHVTSRVVSCRV